MAAVQAQAIARFFPTAGSGSPTITPSRAARRHGTVGISGNTPVTANAVCVHAVVLEELSEARFSHTWGVLREGVSEGVAPGMVAGFWLKGVDKNRVYVGAIGQRRVVPTPEPMLVDTVFDLASVSKVFGTATLAAALIDRAWIKWDTKVAALFPNYAHKDIEIGHLLSHTAGFAAWEPFYEKIREKFSPKNYKALYKVSIHARQNAMRELVFAAKPEAHVGARALYSDISFLLLGFVLEEVTQMPLDQAVEALETHGYQRCFLCAHFKKCRARKT